jgi:hypothetical protein
VNLIISKKVFVASCGFIRKKPTTFKKTSGISNNVSAFSASIYLRRINFDDYIIQDFSENPVYINL